jgi:hypothetical protein
MRTGKVAAVLVGLMMLMLMQVGLANATVVASWPTEFSSVQGTNNWYYLWAYNVDYDATETGHAMTWGGSSWSGGSYGATIYNGMVLPGDLYADGVNKDSTVLRWVSEVDSDLEITGTFQRKTAYPAQYGINGVICAVQINGETKWGKEILSPDTDVYTFDITLSDVNVGDDIDFLVYPGVHNWLDETYLTATISTVPEPATIGLLGLGVLSFIRRKK